MTLDSLALPGPRRSAAIAAAAGAIHMGTGLCRDRSHTAAATALEAFLTAASQPAAPAGTGRPVIHIARCAEHGLHGERVTCFECGHAAEQVPMILAPGSGYRFVLTPGGAWTVSR